MDGSSLGEPYAAAYTYYATLDAQEADDARTGTWAGNYLGDVVVEGWNDPHVWLDLLGFIPIAGEFFDGVNAVLYLVEGDRTNAALSAIAVVPFVGSLATGNRAARNVGGALLDSKIADNGNILHRIQRADGTIVNAIQVPLGDLYDGVGRLVDDVPTNIPTVGPRRPSGFGWAGFKYEGKKWTDALQAAYPNGVVFSSRGFANFTPYVRSTNGNVHQYTFADGVLTGDRAADNARAIQAALDVDPSFVMPPNTVWHHVEDGLTLQLVPTDLHNAIPHTGGAAVIKAGGI